MSLVWIAILLGTVEGLTEFLPISSTGHLILASALIGFEGEQAQAFQIVIQFGAILSVVWDSRARLTRIARAAPHRAYRMGGKLALAFVPAAALGLAFHDLLLRHLFTPQSVAAALIAGGVLILLVERLPLVVRTRSTESVSWGQALGIGASQCLALWPGFSRAAATILGGLTMGLDRPTATQFSFFLAIPTLSAAAGYDLLTSYRALSAADLLGLALASVVSFVVALAAIRWLMHYVSRHSFAVFAYYRIVLGVVILLLVRRL